jgi:hypothetical protein
MRGCTVFFPPHPPVTVFPAKLEQGVPYGSRSNPRVCRWPSRDPLLDYFPEMEYSGIPVSIEDVVVPAGAFKDCIKIATFSISRSFNFKIEKIRLGYLWLAENRGVVKQQLLELSNYFLPQRVNEIADVQFWELEKMEKVKATPVGK